MSKRHKRLLAALIPLVLLAVLVAGSSTASAAQPGNPFAGVAFNVDSQTNPARAQQEMRDSGRNDLAAAIDPIVRAPTAKWFTASNNADTDRWVRDYFKRADQRDPTALVVINLHGLPYQVCAGENLAGHADANGYKHWIDGYARLIGARRAVVVVEPDALAAAGCLSPAQRTERYQLVSYAARTLSALPHTGVYLDIGAGDWLNLKTAAQRLRAAGVRYARGFALNSTHFDWTKAEVAYGVKLGRMLGGKHFVVNTSANGRGPKLRGRYYHEWCNPFGRALGPLPTTRTSQPLADAFYWLNTPGESCGSCNGGPRVGAFWLEWALDITRNTPGARDHPVYRGGGK
jgi:endoglucanase